MRAAEKVFICDTGDDYNYCVYEHISPEGKKYYGYTKMEPEKRWKNGKGYSQNAAFTKDIEKFGWENFEHNILFEGIREADARALEAMLIEMNGSRDKESGYNIRPGMPETEGEHWYVYILTSPDGKRYVGMTGKEPEKRWSRGHGYRNNRLLREDIEKYGWDSFRKESWTYPLTLFSARRIETFLIRYFETTNPENGYNRARGALAESGWHLPEETKEKLRQANRGKKASPETRGKMRRAHRQKGVICTDTGEKFSGVREAAEHAGINPAGITRACSGKQKTAAGRHWEYAK